MKQIKTIALILVIFLTSCNKDYTGIPVVPAPVQVTAVTFDFSALTGTATVTLTNEKTGLIYSIKSTNGNSQTINLETKFTYTIAITNSISPFCHTCIGDNNIVICDNGSQSGVSLASQYIVYTSCH